MNIVQVPAHTNNYSKNTSQKKGIVFHWIVGPLSSSDASFQNPAKRSSAHYGIGDNGEIHQYVEEKYQAWHAGYPANRDYIGIEHAGGQQLSNGSRKKPTQACHDASVELCTDICRRLGISKLVYGVNAFRHKDFMATECCGSLDIDYIINSVNNKLNNSNNNMADYNKALPDESKIKFMSRVNALRGEDTFNAVHWDSLIAYIYSTTNDYEFMVDTVVRNAMDYRNQIEVLNSENTKKDGLLEIHKLRIQELENELNNKNSSSKPFFESKKAIALTTGVISVIVNSIIPLINPQWQMPITELLTLIGAYIGIQGVGDAINNNKK